MEYQADEQFARQLDAADPLRRFRDAFHLPRRDDGSPLIYFCGHSLGLQPKAARQLIEQELEAWAALGVKGHFAAHGHQPLTTGQHNLLADSRPPIADSRHHYPWYSYHQQFRESGARLVGARANEVVMMNALTVNLHLMMATFYRPTSDRFKILMDEPAFPSDRYAVQSQLRHHGIDPEAGLIALAPRAGEHTIRSEDIAQTLDEQGGQIALVWWSGVNFVTGQWFDMAALTELAHRHGCMAGFDLAHAAGNVPLQLHDWGVDFAVWCNYKYLNSGPGAVGGCFVHEKHGENTSLPRLAGWWGNDPATRFQMDTERQFVPRVGADGWQVSNPPILAMAPLKASLDLFDEAGMAALRVKSKRLTGYLEYLLNRQPTGRVEIITPRDPGQRGCALSLLVHDRSRELLQKLERHGIICDFRPPNIVRVAPVPLYNAFEEAWTFANLLSHLLA